MAAIPSTPLVSVEEYIARFVDGGEKPICEYVDGELIPKAMPSKNHSQVRTNIAVLIRTGYGETLNPLTELSTHVRETQFFVPDISVEDLAKPIQTPLSGTERSRFPVH